MSNEVNIAETAYGTLDPGMWVELYNWTTDEADYNRARVKARFFSAIPDPFLPLGRGQFLEFVPSKLDLEITRTWTTVWVWDDGSPEGAHSFQRNVRISNVGDLAGCLPSAESRNRQRVTNSTEGRVSAARP